MITVGQSYPLFLSTYNDVPHVNPVHIRHFKKTKYDPARFNNGDLKFVFFDRQIIAPSSLNLVRRERNRLKGDLFRLREIFCPQLTPKQL